MDELFNEIGLNKNEREVYLAVLRAGKVSPQRVSAQTGINRTTVYSVAKKLRDMGLIGEDIGQKVTYLFANNPESIVAAVEKEEKKLFARKNAAARLAKELVVLPRNTNYSVPRIKFVEESDLSAYLKSEYARWSENAALSDNIWWGFQDDSFTEKYGEFIEWSWKHSPKDLKVRFFANNAPVEREMGKKFSERSLKQLPTGINFDSCFWVAGDFLFMVQTRVRPHYLVEINDAVLARNQRELFKGLWGLAK
jgi:biotin operon repressor